MSESKIDARKYAVLRSPGYCPAVQAASKLSLTRRLLWPRLLPRLLPRFLPQDR